MAHIPHRTGLKSIKVVLKRVCVWVAKFRETWTDFMTEEQLTVMDNLVSTCHAVTDLIDSIFAADS